MNTAIKIEVPAIFQQWGFDQEKIQQSVLKWMVLSLFTENRISPEEAASFLGISREAFLILLQKRGIAYFESLEETTIVATDRPWDDFFLNEAQVSDDFLSERADQIESERENF